MWGYSSGGRPSIPPLATVLAAFTVATASPEANSRPPSSVGVDVTTKLSLRAYFEGVRWPLNKAAAFRHHNYQRYEKRLNEKKELCLNEKIKSSFY